MFDIQVSTEGTIFTTHLMVRGNPWMPMRKSLSPSMMGPLIRSDLQIVRMLGKSSSGHKMSSRAIKIHFNQISTISSDCLNMLSKSSMVYVNQSIICSGDLSNGPVWYSKGSITSNLLRVC